MIKILKNNIFHRSLAVILVSAILLASIPFFAGISSAATVEHGYIKGGSFETTEFWSSGRTAVDSAFDGSYVIKGKNDTEYIYSDGVELSKNVTYTLNFWYRNPTASSEDKVAVFYKGRNGKYTTITTLSLEQTDDWKFCTLNFKHSAYNVFYFGLKGSDVEIDAVSVPFASGKTSKSLIANGSFESAEKSWNVLGDKDIAIKGNGVDGFAAATLPTGLSSGIYFDFPTEKEVYYTVSFKYKGGGADAAWGIARVRDDIDENDIIGQKYALETSSEWKTATATFSSMLRTEHRLVIWSGSSGEITIDAVSVSLDDSDNLIKNGGFEEGFANWKKTTSGTYQIVATPVNSGEKSLKQSTMTNNSKIWQAVDVEPNTRYQISFAYTFLTSSSATTSWLKWAVCDASNDSQAGYNPVTDSAEGFIVGKSHKIEDPNWNNVVVTVDSGEFSRLAIVFQTASQNLVYFDDVVIKKVNVPANIESVLQNPGFESGTNHWEQSTETSVFFKGSVTNSGAGSLKMSEHTYYPKISQTFAVEKGEKYIAIFSSYGKMGSSMWAVTKAFDKDGNPVVSVEANTKDAQTGVLKPSENYITGGTIGASDNWKTVISDIFVPQTDDTYRITFQAHGCTKDAAFIDDVIIFKIDDDGSKLINGDFSMGEIAWAFDSEYFEFSNENYGADGYGMNALPGFHKTLTQSFKTEKNTNYEISFYYKGTFSDEMSGYCISKDGTFEFESVLTKGKLENKNEWTKHSFVANSGKYSTLYLVFQTMINSQYFIDDIKISQMGESTEVSESVVRPYFVDHHNSNPYNDYPYITEDKNNLFSDTGFESGKNFSGEGTEILSDSTAYEGDSYLHFKAGETEKLAYITLPVKRDTTYYATLFVRYPQIDGSKIGKNHISFGFADPDTDDFILTSSPDSEYGRMYTKTIQAVPVAADNAWHLISFSIKTNDAESLKFVIRGTDDTLDIDNLYIFEETNAIKYVSSFEKIEDVAITNKDPELLGTIKAENNLLNEAFNFEGESDFWSVTDSTLLGTDINKGDLNIVNSFHSIQKNSFYYESTARYPRRIYYIRWIDVEPDTEYTFSAKCAITEIGNGSVGIISGYRSDNYSDVTENMKLPTVIKKFSFTEENFIESCDWQSFGVSFNTKERNRVGIMVYDGGGSAYVDDIRLFKTTDAAKVEETADNFPKNLVDNNKSHTLSGGILSGVKAKNSLKDLLRNFENSEYLRVFFADGTEVKDYSTFAATGMQIRLMDGPVIKDKAYITVLGDINGDGLVDNKDSTLIFKHISKVELLEGLYLQVADVDGDGKITVYDSMLSTEKPRTGKASFKLVGPKRFGAGDLIEVQLVCNTDNIKALSGKLILPDGLFYISANSNLSEDSEFYVSEQEKEIYFAINGGAKTEFKAEQVLATFELQVGNISRYSEAEVMLSDVLATTGKDLLSADNFKWTNVTVKPNDDVKDDESQNQDNNTSSKEDINSSDSESDNKEPSVESDSSSQDTDLKDDTSSDDSSSQDSDNQDNTSSDEIPSFDDDSSNDDNSDDASDTSIRLSSLELEETEISPMFDPEIREYTATVPFEIEKVTVTAVAEDPTAVVTIGDTNLEYVGNNIVKVLVETTDGGRRTYKITVTREAPTKTASVNDGLSLWLIILICCGGAAVLAGGTVFAVILIKRKRGKKV